MRVTHNITYNGYVNDLTRQQERLLGLHKQISTGKSVNAPSDDPVKVNTLLTSRGLLSSVSQYDRNADSGLSYLGIAEGALSRAKDTISRLSELAISSNGIIDAGTRANIAIEVNNLYAQLVDQSNTTYDDKYIFSGYETDTAAFTSLGAYQGDANAQAIKTGISTNVTIGVNGGEVFKGVGGGVDIFGKISAFVTALETNDTAGCKTAIDDMSSAFDQVSDAVADIGGKVTRLNALKSDYSRISMELRTVMSGIEDADMAKVISDMQLGQAAMEASLKSAGRIFATNIFDYL
ncbi:MAG: flagellar hook-associated protein FlgL [Deltaproteobacteria bacterium]